jgi:hypothetical protein
MGQHEDFVEMLIPQVVALVPAMEEVMLDDLKLTFVLGCGYELPFL